MNVKDFVRKSLQQIVAGVQEAQQNVAATGATINPGVNTGTRTNMEILRAGSSRLFDLDNFPIGSVSFDLAVTVEDGSRSEGSANGEAGIRVMGLAFGVGASTTDSDESKRSSVSRLKFNVLVKLPSNMRQQ